MWITTKIFVVVTLTVVISQYNVLDMLPFSPHEAKAVKAKTPLSSSVQAPSSKDGNTNSPPSPTQSSNASPSGCINYDMSVSLIYG